MARRKAIGQLTVRDREILHWIGQGGIASLSQLARRFWPNRQVETALDRLRQLDKAGYLKMHVCDARKLGERVFTLTREGALLFDAAVRESFYIGLPGPAELRQQMLAQDAYMALEAEASERGAQLVRWTSERALRAEMLRAQYREAEHREGSRTHVEIADARLELITAYGEREILYVEIDGAYYGKMLYRKAQSLSKSEHPVVWVCAGARADYIQRTVGPYPNIRVFVLDMRRQH